MTIITESTDVKYKGTLLVVKNCNTALKFYRDIFGFERTRDNEGNMEFTGGLYLQYDFDVISCVLKSAAKQKLLRRFFHSTANLSSAVYTCDI